MDEMRRQLAALMESVDSGEDGGKSRKSFSDFDVCKYFLCGLCPHDLFQNTKQYMGPCPNIHSDELREQYLESRKRKAYGYEELSVRYLKPHVEDCDRRICRQTAGGRCDTQDKASESIEASAQRQVEDLEQQIRVKMKEAEELGNQGNVEGSIKVMDLIQELNMKKKLALEEKNTKVEEARSMWFQKLKPCDICGALLSEKDGENRLNEHFLGRIHLGFEAIRKHLQELNDYITLVAPLLPRHTTTQSTGHTTRMSSTTAQHNLNGYKVIEESRVSRHPRISGPSSRDSYHSRGNNYTRYSPSSSKDYNGGTIHHRRRISNDREVDSDCRHWRDRDLTDSQRRHTTRHSNLRRNDFISERSRTPPDQRRIIDMPDTTGKRTTSHPRSRSRGNNEQPYRRHSGEIPTSTTLSNDSSSSSSSSVLFNPVNVSLHHPEDTISQGDDKSRQEFCQHPKFCPASSKRHHLVNRSNNGSLIQKERRDLSDTEEGEIEMAGVLIETVDMKP